MKLIHKNRFLLLPMIGVILLSSLEGCRRVEVPTLSPQELSIQQTRVALQEQTRQAIYQMTRCSQAGNCDQDDTDTGELTPEVSQTETILVQGSTAVIISTPITEIQPSMTTSTTLTPTPQKSPVSTNSAATPSTTLMRTPTRTSTVTQTVTPTHTATVQTGWNGQWTVYLEQYDGTYLSGILMIDLNETQLTGSSTLGGVTYTFKGAIYEQGTIATGSWRTDTSNGSFWLTKLEDELFGGSTEEQLAFCGSRPGLLKPEPCKALPTS